MVEIRKGGRDPAEFFYKKGVDIRAGILYNKDRSEEERKTLGPTADLHFFKLYVQLVWPAAMPAATVVRTKVFLTKCKKGVAI